MIFKKYLKNIDNTKETPEIIEDSGVLIWSRVRESNPLQNRHQAL